MGSFITAVLCDDTFSSDKKYIFSGLTWKRMTWCPLCCFHGLSLAVNVYMRVHGTSLIWFVFSGERSDIDGMSPVAQQI